MVVLFCKDMKRKGETQDEEGHSQEWLLLRDDVCVHGVLALLVSLRVGVQISWYKFYASIA